MDAGAVAAIERGSSLFPSGVTSVSPPFGDRDAVRLFSADGREVARAVVNYSAEACAALAGRRTADKVDEALGFTGPDELAHRRNIVLIVPNAATSGEAE